MAVILIIVALYFLIIASIYLNSSINGIQQLRQDNTSSRIVNHHVIGIHNYDIWKAGDFLLALNFNQTSTIVTLYSDNLEIIWTKPISINFSVQSVADVSLLSDEFIGLYIEERTGLTNSNETRVAYYFIINILTDDIHELKLGLPQDLATTTPYTYQFINMTIIRLVFINHNLTDHTHDLRQYYVYMYDVNLKDLTLIRFLIQPFILLTREERFVLIDGLYNQDNFQLIFDYQTQSEHKLINYKITTEKDSFMARVYFEREIPCDCKILNHDLSNLSFGTFRLESLTYYFNQSNTTWDAYPDEELRFWRSYSDNNGSIFAVSRKTEFDSTNTIIVSVKYDDKVFLKELDVLGLENFENSAIQKITKINQFLFVKLLQISNEGITHHIFQIEISSNLITSLIEHISLPIIGIFLLPGVFFVHIFVFKSRKERTNELYPKF